MCWEESGTEVKLNFQCKTLVMKLLLTSVSKWPNIFDRIVRNKEDVCHMKTTSLTDFKKELFLIRQATSASSTGFP